MARTATAHLFDNPRSSSNVWFEVTGSTKFVTLKRGTMELLFFIRGIYCLCDTCLLIFTNDEAMKVLRATLLLASFCRSPPFHPLADMYDMTLELTSQRPTNLKTEAHLNIVRIIGLISSHCSNTRAEEDEQQQQ